MGIYQGVGFSETTHIPDDLFILNPSLQRMVTGKRNYGYLWNQFGWGTVIAILFVMLMLAFAMPRFINEVRLATMKTTSTEARITEHRISRGKSTTYYVTYEFTDNDHTYSREDTVSSSEYSQWPIGKYVSVTYAADDPNTSHLGGQGLRFGSIVFIPIILIMFVIVGGVIWFHGRSTRMKVKRLRQDGQLIFGQLMSSTGQMVRRGSGKSRRNDFDVTIYCQFISPTGKRIDTQATYTRNDLKKKELQIRGSIAVLYGQDNDYMVL